MALGRINWRHRGQGDGTRKIGFEFDLIRGEVAMAIAEVTNIGGTQTALDELLALICEELQISESKFKLAEQRYHAIADWLDADDSPLRRFSPTIYPQGSVATGTTIPPFAHLEYDLDMVCEFRTDLFLLSDAVQVLDGLEGRLKQH